MGTEGWGVGHGVGQGLYTCGIIKGTVHSDIQEVCRSSRVATALLLKIIGGAVGHTVLLTSYLMLST